ncbi:hypothetical protein BJ322DRAFT_1111368 [Thelephora terrestris]|uniref:Uncharacterized protein n=1 Tax=Thelephora terrestris TaxID=56493 RepID=A0A9P6HAD0_9AGAM|nr:hypothetical protein BJ322DRAFT_1111368 [Thelephora terrestris]
MDTQRPRPRARRRDSDSVLRASVLDAAIELGIGNKTVAKWMFSPVEEGDEEDEPEQVQTTSELPNHTSEEHSQLPTSAQYSWNHQSLPQGHAVNGGSTHAAHISTSSASTHSNHLLPPASPRKLSYNKLRKAKPDGYDTDGGYVSDATRKKSKKSKKKVKDGAVTGGEESEGGYLSEASPKRKVSFFSRKKTKKSKDDEKHPVPPVPHLATHFSAADRFGLRSNSPSTFASSNRSSWTDVAPSRNATHTSTPAPPPPQFQEDAIQALTHAFKEDAQSIAGSFDWSNTYSHFPRVVQTAHPPLPGSTRERPHTSPKPSLPAALTTAQIRPLKTRPSPLSLSPLSSDYRHASEHSPVPSEAVMMSPDPTSPPSTSTLRNKLLIAANTTPAALLPTHSSPGPSPTEPTPPFDFFVPVSSPGGSIRSRQFELPPPSPAPQGPLPKVPPISPPNDYPHNHPLLKKPSVVLPSRLTPFGLPPGTSPARTPSPSIRGKEQPFPTNPAIRVQEDTDTGHGEPYYPKNLNNPTWAVPRQPPPLSASSAPAVVPSRKSVGASSYTSSHMESEIEAIEALYHDVDGDELPDEILNHAEVDSVISMFGGQSSTQESGLYEREPRRSNDEELANGRLSKPLRIPLDEDDYVSPTGGYLDMDSDLEDDPINLKEDEKYTVWDRQSFMDESRSGETKNRFVRNIEALYRRDGRERSVIGGAPVVRKPAAYI